MVNPGDPQYIINENGFYYVASMTPEPGSYNAAVVTVSAKGVANGLSEKYNDGFLFGPDTYNPNSTATPPYTQTSGIQEAVSTGKPVSLLIGTYQLYAEITPTNLMQNFILVGAGAPLARNGSIVAPANGNATILIQNTAGLGIININMPVGLLEVGNFIGIFTQPTTGHGFASNPESWFASNPPTSENDLPMSQGWIIRQMGMFNVDADHYGFRFANLGSTGYVETIFGFGYGGFYSWHAYTPTSSFVYNFGNAVMIGYKIWQMGSTTSTVNIVDYSVSYQSTSAVSSINLIYSIAPIDILAAAGTLTPYLLYADPNYAYNIIDYLTTADLSSGLVSTIALNNITLYILGAIGSNTTVIGYTTLPYAQQQSLQIASTLLLESILSVNGITYTNGGRNSGSFKPNISITNPPVSGTIYQNTNGYDIEIDLPADAATSGTAGYVTIAKGATSTPTAIGNQYVSGDTSDTSEQIIRLKVPANWYYSFTASGVTFGTASVFAE